VTELAGLPPALAVWAIGGIGRPPMPGDVEVDLLERVIVLAGRLSVTSPRGDLSHEQVWCCAPSSRSTSMRTEMFLMLGPW
jgi:hypothetical protein